MTTVTAPNGDRVRVVVNSGKGVAHHNRDEGIFLDLFYETDALLSPEAAREIAAELISLADQFDAVKPTQGDILAALGVYAIVKVVPHGQTAWVKNDEGNWIATRTGAIKTNESFDGVSGLEIIYEGVK